MIVWKMGIPKSESNTFNHNMVQMLCWRGKKGLLDMEVSVTANKTPNVLTIQCD